MGGGGRRRRATPRASPPGSTTSPITARRGSTPSLFAAAFRARARDPRARSPRSTNSPSRSPARPSGGWRRRAQGDAFLAAARAAWPCAALDAACGERPGRLSRRRRRGGGRPRASRSSARRPPSRWPVRQSRLGGGCGSARSARPTARSIARRAHAAACRRWRRGPCLTRPRCSAPARLRSDIAAMKHETQYSRLFRS